MTTTMTTTEVKTSRRLLSAADTTLLPDPEAWLAAGKVLEARREAEDSWLTADAHAHGDLLAGRVSEVRDNLDDFFADLDAE